MKIGLYTIHATNNVGAMLQTFATIKTLQEMGAEVEVVNLYTREEEEQNHNRRKVSPFKAILRAGYILLHPQMRVMERHFEEFHSSMPLSKRYYSAEEYMKSPLIYDIHLVGSDQVWNVQRGYNHSRFYFLDYLPREACKKSYAASFGNTESVRDIIPVSQALKTFKAISVRENNSVSLVKGLTGKECTQVLDPTLLLNSVQWDKEISNERIIQNPYIFYYGVNSDNNTWNIIQRAKKELNIPVVGYPGPIPSKYRFDRYILDGGPLQFINLIKYAELVITSSFHGLAFSVNYGKKFMVVKYGTRMERMESLMRILGVENSIVQTADEASSLINREKSNSMEKCLAAERKKSLDWIKREILG